MAIVKNSARYLRDCGLNLFGGSYYALSRLTSTIILMLR
jgi:hypothetical protein